MLLEKLTTEENALNEANESLAVQIEAQSMGKEDSEERKLLLVEINKLEGLNKELDSELKKHEDNDPEVINHLKTEYMKAKEDCNRWTGIVIVIHLFRQSVCITILLLQQFRHFPPRILCSIWA